MMRLLPLSALCLAMVLAASSAAQDTTNYPVLGKIHRHDDRLDKLIPKDAKIEVLSSGFEWTEGPLWVKEGDGGYLLFSDIPRNSVMKWVPGQGASLWMKPSGYTGVAEYKPEPGSNGLILDPHGRVVFCEHGDRRISVLSKNGGKITLVDNYMGRRLNSPNDGTFKSNGDFYFTDPPYGLPNRWDDRMKELDFQGVYRLSPGQRSDDDSWPGPNGVLTLLTKELKAPNGIGFSPDEKTLYVAQSDPDHAIWMAYPVKDDGTLGKGKVFADATDMARQKLPGLPDGLKIDKNGNLFATGPGGVHIFAPDGTRLGRLETGERTSNVAWGDDGSTLYITADTYLCRIKTTTKGARWK